jgi:endonuclease YncB( thermonuclease family)
MLARAVALALVLAPCGPPAAGEPGAAGQCRLAAARTTQVAAVLDGDTVRLEDGRIVRLAGIEAPKRPLGGSTADRWPLAEAAREGLAGLIAGKTVAVATIGPEPDRYGRLVGHLSLSDGTWIEAALVRRGLARARPQPDDMACFSVLVSEEAVARAGHRGLWRDQDYAIRAADDPSLADRKGLYELVEGRVVSVGHGRRMIFLDFGSDYRRDFTIMVNSDLAERLAETGVAVDALEGRRVRVRGVIEESGGPAVRISDPAEIELLDDREDAGQ